MERFKPKTLDTLPLPEVIEALSSQESGEYVSKGSEVPKLVFDQKDRNLNNYGLIPMTAEEYERLQYQIIPKENEESKCRPEYFSDRDIGVRHTKAQMVNLYNEYGGSWQKMRSDARCVGDATLRRYWTDPIFRACIMAFDDIFTLKAKSVITDLMDDDDSKVRLAAASRWLEANEPEKWNSGVQKQIMANKGSLQNTLFQKIVSEKDFKQTIAQDPFFQKQAIGDRLDTQTSQVVSTVMPKDPFGD